MTHPIPFVLPAALLAAGLFAQERQPAPTPAPTAPAARSPRADLQLPTAAQLPDPVTAVLFDRPGPDALWALGRAWKASFDGRGFTFIPFFGPTAPRNFPLRFELLGATVGGETLALTPGQPVVDGTIVRTARGGLLETVALTLGHAEQSFVFADLPNRGAIAVTIGIDTELAASATTDGLHFAGEFGAVHYTHAVAVDAAGRQQPLAIAWDGSAARIEIPAAFVERARLPLVLDPVINTTIAIGAGTTSIQRSPDTATLQGPDRVLVTWQRQFSAADQDCFAAVYDNAWNLVSPPTVTIDFTGNSWSPPQAAASNFARNFLVVAQADSASSSWIAGRTVGETGTTSLQLDIERNGTTSLSGNNFRPTVGGDPFFGSLAWYCVVYEHETAATNRDLYFRRVNQDGTLATTVPTLLASTATNETHPAISKSNQTQDWVVVWQRTWPSAPFDEDVHAAHIRWNGQIAVPDYLVAGSVATEVSPSVSSAADVGDGQSYYLLAWHQLRSGFADNDIQVRVYDGTGTFKTSWNLSQNESLGAFQANDQIEPRIDSDGHRFALVYNEFDPVPFDYFARVDTIAYVPDTTSLRLDETRVATGFSGARIAAYHSGGLQTSTSYAVAGWTVVNNSIRGQNYAGYVPGNLFSTFFSGCGSLPITANGSPTVGGTIDISVPHTGLSGTLFGFPGFANLLPIFGCSCTIGVQNGIISANPLIWTVPNNPVFVGTTLSVQGYSAGGNGCFGILDFSSTVDFTIR